MTGRIERVTLTHLQIPLKEPLSAPDCDATVKDAVLVTVETRQGVGLGESSPLPSGPGAPSESVAGCWDYLVERIAPSLLGQAFRTPDDIARLAGSWTGCSFARTGAETACWDLLAQSRHATVAELLGASSDPVAMRVESGLSLGLYPTIVELLRAIETHLEEGYRRVKIRIAPGRDIELVRAVRQHFGEVPLMVDAAAAYSVDDLDIFRALDDHDLLMFEQPMAADDLEGLALLQSEVSTPVSIDESAGSLESVADAIRRGACRIVNLKLQRLGGFGPALAIHDHCREHGVACWVGTMPELGIGQAQGIHLAALDNCRYPTDIEPSARWFVDDYVAPRIELSSPGVLSVPTRPGLGYQVDHSALKRYQVRQYEVAGRTIG